MEPKPYSVKYARFDADPKKLRWAQLVGVVEDGILPNGTHRYFRTSQDERYEVPMNDMVFLFSKERQQGIVMRAEEQAKAVRQETGPAEVN